MKPDLQYLRRKFAEFNTAIFAGRLPEPEITLCEASSFVAQYRHDGGRHRLRFSLLFDLEERELEDTVIHEMIHYFISYHRLHDRTSHGPLFKALMQSVNEGHGREVNISKRLSQAEAQTSRSKRRKWHVIAIIRFATGQTGVKVLPRVVDRVLEYHSRMVAASNVISTDLYLHDDPFFNRYPTSTGRRCHLITDAEMKEHLKGAHTLRVENGKLIQK